MNHYLGLVLEDFTYQRRDNIIRYPRAFELCEQYNYVMYKNPEYKDRFYYAYITDMKYINDNMTEIKIKTDVFQSWQFDFIYKRSYIEREHVNDDTIGKHTIPEAVELGEYVVDSYDMFNDLDGFAIVVLASKPVNASSSSVFEREAQVIHIGGIPFYRLVLCNR